jgi:hypothetical protein
VRSRRPPSRLRAALALSALVTFAGTVVAVAITVTLVVAALGLRSAAR